MKITTQECSKLRHDRLRNWRRLRKLAKYDFKQKKDTCFKTQGAPESCILIRNYEKAEKLCPKCNCIIDESEDPNQPQDFFIENKKQHQLRLLISLKTVYFH